MEFPGDGAETGQSNFVLAENFPELTRSRRPEELHKPTCGGFKTHTLRHLVETLLTAKGKGRFLFVVS